MSDSADNLNGPIILPLLGRLPATCVPWLRCYLGRCYYSASYYLGCSGGSSLPLLLVTNSEVTADGAYGDPPAGSVWTRPSLDRISDDGGPGLGPARGASDGPGLGGRRRSRKLSYSVTTRQRSLKSGPGPGPVTHGVLRVLRSSTVRPEPST